jgi:hypothetical protein
VELNKEFGEFFDASKGPIKSGLPVALAGLTQARR